ncbi:hypothetical protein RIR_jg11974.t1 [Rhizophagus irregularis DAOM 181602=DAOM 197198]|uniref:Uncharacterized protein n=1 Tax=Rhizophagus irregularis (strain DAOM 181602 / DAOM 197198 / MUCL 43194) TaxID=747089 RepID=U9TQY6_RHIID|nr:hypothetical protein RIR_jg11974.t1 [Rhizophagus irregularis DAOM 181602=DAOM 197198]
MLNKRNYRDLEDPIRTFKLESDKLSTQQIEGRNVIEDYFETFHFGNGKRETGNGKREKGRGERKGKVHIHLLIKCKMLMVLPITGFTLAHPMFLLMANL